MSENNEKRDSSAVGMFLVCVLLIFALFYSVYIFQENNTALKSEEQLEHNYINADEWTEKCVEYENITKVYYNIEQDCKVFDGIMVICSDESIITEIKNESVCVETILVKNKQTTTMPIISNEINNGTSYVVYIESEYYEERV